MTPHCDPQVLHAPGECAICDTYAAERQKIRIFQGICFTGHEPDGVRFFTPCPSTRVRSVETINKWPGNRPQPAFGDIVDNTGKAPVPRCVAYRLTWRERIIALFTGEYLGEQS